MLRLSQLISGFLFTAIFITCWAIVLAGDNSDSDVPASEWDFGYLPQKSEVNHTFYINNLDSKPLTVTKINAGCSCTSTSEIKDPIAPGDSAAIVITLKSGRYRGKIKKTTEVYTDDLANPMQKARPSLSNPIFAANS